MPAPNCSPMSANARQGYKYSFPYYSTVRFAPVIGGATPFTYTVTSGAVARAFAYKIGDAPTIAGYSATYVATAAETNLLTSNETIGGENVLIKGIAAILEPWSDARLAATLFPNISVELSLNGDQNRYKLGTLSMLPGGCGITGVGRDAFASQPLAGGRPQFSFPTNGLPVAGNIFRMPEGLIWRNKAAADSMLNVICTAQRTTLVTAVADEAAAAGVRGYVHPVVTDAGSAAAGATEGPLCVDIKFVLVGMVVGERSYVS